MEELKIRVKPEPGQLTGVKGMLLEGTFERRGFFDPGNIGRVIRHDLSDGAVFVSYEYLNELEKI